jgi:hypothetical protein
MWLSLTKLVPIPAGGLLVDHTPLSHVPINLIAGISLGAPLIWIAAIAPRRGGLPIPQFTRTLIAALATLEMLQAYPSAGSQVIWSATLLIIVGGICIGDGMAVLSDLGTAWRPEFPVWRSVSAIPVTAFVVCLCVGPVDSQYSYVRQSYRAGVPLDLPGASRLQIPAEQASTLRRLSASLQRRCQTFLTLPGLGSLYLFSEEEPPTQRNVTVWMYYFDADEQRDIVRQAQQFHPLCAVRDRNLLNFWRQASGPIPSRPLYRFINRDFRVARTFGEYEFMVQRDMNADTMTSSKHPVTPPGLKSKRRQHSKKSD